MVNSAIRSDGDLLGEFVSRGDERAFAEIVSRHSGMVVSLCRRHLGTSSDADDAAQAVFITLARKAKVLRGKDSIAGWLHHVARHICLHALRATATRARLERRATLTSSNESEDASMNRFSDVLDEELSALPQRYRVPIILHHLEGLTLAEIASTLECGPSAISMRLTRGIARLRERLLRRGLHIASSMTLAAALSETAQAAEIPAGFVAAVAKASSLALAGDLAASISPASNQLVEGALRMIRLTQIKIVSGIVAASTLLSGGLLLATVAFTSEAGAQPKNDKGDKAAAAMPAWRKGMPVGKFSPIPGSAPSKSVEAMRKGSATEVNSIKDAFLNYCGLATVIGAKGEKALVVNAGGGGHAGTEQNGVYALDLLNNAPTWVALRASTGDKAPGDNQAYFPDGRPTGTHTYYALRVAYTKDETLIIRTLNQAASYTGFAPGHTDCYHLEKGDWDLKGAGWPGCPINGTYCNTVAQDPRTQFIYMAGVNDSRAVFDPIKREWKALPSNGIGAAFAASIILPEIDAWVTDCGTYLDGDSPGERSGSLLDVFTISSNRFERVTLKWKKPKPATPFREAAMSRDPNTGMLYWLSAGVRYDETNKPQEAHLIRIDPKTWEAEELCTTIPGMHSAYNRFEYIPALNGFYWAPSFWDDVQFFPLK